jgi:hypothetical protein
MYVRSVGEVCGYAVLSLRFGCESFVERFSVLRLCFCGGYVGVEDTASGSFRHSQTRHGHDAYPSVPRLRNGYAFSGR